MAANLEKEIQDLKTELKRLQERVERQAWGNPHDFAYRALAQVEMIRDYYASGARGIEMIRQVVEMLRITAAGRVGSQTAGIGPAFIYGLADLIEGVYLENRYHTQVYAFAQKREREERQRELEARKREEEARQQTGSEAGGTER